MLLHLTPLITHLLELIFSDSWGPVPFKSNSGFSYYITFVDSCTRFTWTNLLKAKSKALNAFKLFQSLTETQFDTKIKAVQTNWG